MSSHPSKPAASPSNLVAAFAEIISFIDQAPPFQRTILNKMVFNGMDLKSIAESSLYHLDNSVINE